MSDPRVGQSPKRVLLALPFLSTGAALVAYILSGISLPLVIAINVCLGGLLAYRVWRHTSAEARPQLKKRAWVGVVAGIAAIFAYDAIRLFLVKAFHITFWPFDIFSIFGRALLGAEAPATAKLIAGVLFHCANGIGFGVAFVFLWRRPTIWAGITWGLFLECCMISLYPGWLRINLMEEFLSVSILGHITYGSVLGGIAQRLLSTSDTE